jgi:hypothetical protein
VPDCSGTLSFNRDPELRNLDASVFIRIVRGFGGLEGISDITGSSVELDVGNTQANRGNR